MSHLAIQLVSLNKTYMTHERAIVVLRDVNLSIRQGEFISVSGRSGIGKTTLLNLISALDHPTSGNIIVCGTPYERLHEEELAEFRCLTIGYVFQDYNLISTLTARENIEFARDIAGFRITGFDARVHDLLDQVGLSDRAQHLPGQLSGGEQQRLAFARALANDPTILLADEPTGNLDDTSAQRIHDILHRVHRDGKTLLVATHDDAIRHLADRQLRIDNGAIMNW